MTGLQKTTKRITNILVAVQRLTIFGIDLFLNTLNLSIPFSFIYPKISIANLDEHTLIQCMCGRFTDRDANKSSQIDI